MMSSALSLLLLLLVSAASVEGFTTNFSIDSLQESGKGFITTETKLYGTERSISGSGPLSEAIFQNHRYFPGTFEYYVTGFEPGSTNELKLGFAEIWEPYCTKGGRVMNITVNGIPFMSFLDVYEEAGGCLTAHLVVDNVVADDFGNFEIEFTSVSKSPMISYIAIETISSTLTSAAPTDLVISEFLASNKNNIQDEDGDYSDWLEVHNAGNETVNLGGLYLTDDAANPTQWPFPSLDLPADEYIVIFASSKDRVDPGSALHTNFKLGAGGEYLGLYDTDGTTVLSEYSPEYPAQTEDRSYGIDSNGDLRYFSNPTPGSANGVGDEPVAESPTASVDRGFYSSSFSVELSTAQAGGQIRYTLDGSEPTPSNGNNYNSPISVTTTTILRAVTFANDVLPSPTSTYTYIFLEDVIEQPSTISGFPNGVSRDTGSQGSVPLDMEMDPQVVNEYSSEILDSMIAIPTMSLTANIDDIFGSNGFYFQNNEKKVSIEILHADPSQNEQIDVGVESHSHDRLKRSLRLNFRTEYGNREWDTKLLSKGVNGGSAVEKYRTLILRAGNNRSWARSWNPDATTYTEDEFYRATFIEMNDGVGPHGTFVHLYLNGVYWGVYNLVERPDDDFAAEYFGGDDDDWFFTNHGGAGSADSSRWDYLTGQLANKDMSNSQNYQEMQEYLDVQSFADYLLTAFYIGLTDWPQNNWYVILRNDASPLGPTPAQFQAWDGEWALDRRQGGGDGATIPSEFISCSGSSKPITDLWCSLRQSDEFMDLFASRVALHTAPGGALSTDVALARWDLLNASIESAIVGESARWGDSLAALGGEYDVTRTRDGDWQDEVDIIRNLLQGNTEQLIQELEDNGLYTYTEPPDPPSPTFAVTQMHYHPADPTAEELAAGFVDADDFEFIVLENIAQQTLDVADLSFDIGITLANPSSRMVSPGEAIVFVANLAAFSSRYPAAQFKVAGVYEGKLSNGGEQIVAQYAGNVIASFEYADVEPWPLEADGSGPSLHVVDITGDLNDPTNWIAAPAMPFGQALRTSAPIAAPTDAPVVPPTNDPPTDAPIVAPTDAPVDPPTDAPVTAPIVLPTPVAAPIVLPTDAPVDPPTDPGDVEMRLVYAPTSTEVFTLFNGAIVSISDLGLPGAAFNIIAEPKLGVAVEGASFSNGQYEVVYPYAYCGNNGGDFYTCVDLAVGSHTVSVTPKGPGGQDLLTVTVSFTIVDGPVSPTAPTAPTDAPTKAPTVQLPIDAPTKAPTLHPANTPPTSLPTIVPVSVVRINCGEFSDYTDSEANVWVADNLFIGGGEYVDTANEIEATEDDLLFQSERNGDFNYSIPAPSAGVYSVSLLFAELFFTAEDQRVFEVFIEGTPSIEMDIVGAAGANTAITQSKLVYVTDGMLNIEFKSIINLATISAIMVEGPVAKTLAPTTVPLTVAPTPVPVSVIRINCGAYLDYTDSESNMWAADNSYLGGGEFLDTADEIEATEDDLLFQSERHGDFNYSIPLTSDGVYNVTLLFAELFFTDVDQRVFEVSVEGIPSIEMDIVGAAGANTAVLESMLVSVNDTTLDIVFVSIINSAKVSAIMVEGPLNVD